jgi:hypothetical protein
LPAVVPVVTIKNVFTASTYCPGAERVVAALYVDGGRDAVNVQDDLGVLRIHLGVAIVGRVDPERHRDHRRCSRGTSAVPTRAAPVAHVHALLIMEAAALP